MAKDQNSGNQESLEGDMDDALNAAAAEMITEMGDSLDEPIQSETDVHQEESIDDSNFEELEDSQTGEQEQKTQVQEKEQTVADQEIDQTETTNDQEAEGKPESQSQKDYKKLQAAYTKSQQALKDQEARLAAMEQSVSAQQQQQQVASLKPYQPESPDYQAFQPKKAQMDIVAESIRELESTLPGEENADARDRLTIKLSKKFSDADWQMWTESHQFENQRKQAFYENPEQSFGKMIDERLNNHHQQQQVMQQASSTVNTIFNDPTLRKAINADGGGNALAIQMQQNIEQGMSVQVAAQIAVKDYQILQFQQGQQTVNKTKNRVDERQRLMRDDANLQTVNPVTASTDVEEQLKAKGIVPGSDNYDNRLLDSLMLEDDAWEESPTRS